MSLPETLRAQCPRHGLVDFNWEIIGNWWMCDHWVTVKGAGPRATAQQWRDHPDCCRAVIPREWFTPDGGDVGVTFGGLVERVA